MTRNCLTFISLICLSLFLTPIAQADWLDKVTDAARDITKKAEEVIDLVDPDAPTTTTDADGQAEDPKPAAAPAPATSEAPQQNTVAAPEAPETAAPALTAPTGNNDTALVMATQKELKRLGYGVGVDGAYGPNTKEAITAFQNSQDMTADGNVSPGLVSALQSTPTQMASTTPETSVASAGTAKANEMTKAPLETTPETPKAEKVAAKKEYVVKDEATLMATLSPTGKMSYEYCENHTLRTPYSCGCLGEKTDEMVPGLQEKMLVRIKPDREKLNAYIAEIKANTKYPDEIKTAKIENSKNQFDQDRQEYDYIKNRSGWDDKIRKKLSTRAMSELTRSHICRRPDGIREKEFASCMGGNNPNYEKGNEEYCRCVGDAAAEHWMKPDSPTGSQALSWVTRKAWSQCSL